MKYVLTSMMVLALFAGKVALADDSEAKAENSVTTSENPVTGTVTTKKKMVRKHKDMAGNMHTKTHKEKIKHKTDGSTSTSSETEEEHK